MKIFCGHRDKHNVWFRIFGVGLCFRNGPPLFSERMGFKKCLRLPFGWRAEVLKRQNWRLRPGDKMTGEAGERLMPKEKDGSNG